WARPRRPRRLFRSDDFPTFERPASAISGGPGGGSPPGTATAVTKRARSTFMRPRADGAARRPGRSPGFARLVRGGQPERLVHGAHRRQVLLAERALLERLDEHRRLVLARLAEVEDRALVVRRRGELELRLHVRELEVDRLGRDAVLGRIHRVPDADVLHLEAGREDVELADDVDRLRVALILEDLGLEDVVRRVLLEALGMRVRLEHLVERRVELR